MSDTNYDQLSVTQLYDLQYAGCAKGLLENVTYPWEILGELKNYIIQTGKNLPRERYNQIDDNIWIARNAVVAPSASITGPCIIEEGAEIRHCAFIRGSVIVGKNSVVGNSTELKNVILFEKVQVPHYNYVGDSVLGHFAHMGAGSITSNVKSDKKLVVVHVDSEHNIETGLKKFGAMIGDHVEVGCGSILNPGTVIGPNSNIYPLSSVRGYVNAGSIYKQAGEIAAKRPD